MTKLLQRGRLAAYLEQSTRYMPYDVPIGDGLGYRYWRHPELGPEYEAAMDFLFESYSEALPRVEAWAAERFPRAGRRAGGGARPLHPREGARPAARAAARGLAVARRDLRLGPGVRAAAAPPVRLAAARGARLRVHDPGGAEGGGAELRRARGAARARRRVDLVPRGARAGRRALGRAARPRPGHPRRGDRPRRAAPVRAGERGGAARRAPVRGRRGVGGRDARGASQPPAGRARGDAGRAGRRAREPPPPPRPRLRGAQLPVRGRVRLRRVPRPAAPPAPHRPVADARPGAGRGRAARARRRRASATCTAPAWTAHARSTRGSRMRGIRSSLTTRSRSGTGSATCST